MGTIRKRSGNWEILWYEGGRKRSATVRGKKSEAALELARREVAAKDGKPQTKEKLHAYLDRWLARREPQLRRNTVNSYAMHIGRIKAGIPDCRLDALTPSTIDAFYARLLSGGLSPQTVVHVHRVLSNALAYAVRLEMVADNPAVKVKPPGVRQKPPRAVTYEQALEAVLAASDRYRAPLFLLLHTGMRRSEVCALWWEDVDLDKRVIRVTASIDNVQDKIEAVRSDTKTERSRRTIPISDHVCDVLKAQRQTLDAEAPYLPFGEERAASPYVFPNSVGGMMTPGHLTEGWRSACRRVGLTARLHDLRHTHASLLLALGVEVPVVSARLGHASSAVTMSIYSHQVGDRQRDAVDKFEDFARRSGKEVAK